MHYLTNTCGKIQRQFLCVLVVRIGRGRDNPAERLLQRKVMVIQRHAEGVLLNVKVIPRSSGNAIAGPRRDRLAIKITAPPVEGRANKALLKFLGKKLGIPQSSISILTGSSSREKTVLLKGIDEETVTDRLMPRSQQSGLVI